MLIPSFYSTFRLLSDVKMNDSTDRQSLLQQIVSTSINDDQHVKSDTFLSSILEQALTESHILIEGNKITNAHLIEKSLADASSEYKHNDGASNSMEYIVVFDQPNEAHDNVRKASSCFKEIDHLCQPSGTRIAVDNSSNASSAEEVLCNSGSTIVSDIEHCKEALSSSSKLCVSCTFLVVEHKLGFTFKKLNFGV